jgi:hypothetical protein
MKKLDELNDAVLSLNALSLVCPKKDKEKILDKRDELDRQAIALADKLLKEGTPELVDAINALSELTKTAIKAKKEIDNIGKNWKNYNKDCRHSR